MTVSYEHLTGIASQPSSLWSNRDRVVFEAFNINGLVARKRANDDRIRALVDSGVVPSGWHIAYGSFSDFNVDTFYKLLDKRRVGRIELEVAIELLTEEIDKVSKKCDEVEAFQESTEGDTMIKRIHINQHHIRANAKDGSALPVITCKTSKGNIKGSTCTIHGDSEIVYSADKPLSCGAKVWIQTTAPVTIDCVTYN